MQTQLIFVLLLLAMTSFSVKCSTVTEFYKAGVSTANIFRHLSPLGYSRAFVYRIVKRITEGKPLHDERGKVKSCSVRTPNLIKAIKARFKRNPARSVRKVAREMKISETTMRRLVSNNLQLRSYKLRKGHMLNARQRQARLEKCKRLLLRFNDEDVEKIIFSDEKMFNVEMSWNAQNNRIYATQRSDIPISAQIRQRTSHPASVMVWAGVSMNGKTDLVFVDKGIKIKSQNYIDDILEPHLIPCGEQLFGNGRWCFQQDSAPAHSAKVTQLWCSTNLPDFIATSDWPASSPDLNPLDYFVWSKLQQMVCCKNYASITALKAALQRGWANLPQEEVCAAIQSWKKRLRLCVKNRGGHFET
jgi:inhibitor of nuclear factor kappa-B kinase subunit alpha